MYLTLGAGAIVNANRKREKRRIVMSLRHCSVCLQGIEEEEEEEEACFHDFS